jgi:molybdopterin-guanine dinucleotide biosynthesis adapter protein
MHPVIIGLYGKSGSGKTSLIVNLIKKLNKDGYSVATIKQTDKPINVDTLGKDTWKYQEAGSSVAVLSSSAETDFFMKEKKTQIQIIDLIRVFGTYDIILVEGVNDPNIPKIRVGECTEREKTICNYHDNMNEIYTLIIGKINDSRDFIKKNKIEVKVNGKTIPLTEFPSVFIINTILGMLRSLKGVDGIETAEILFNQ